MKKKTLIVTFLLLSILAACTQNPADKNPAATLKNNPVTPSGSYQLTKTYPVEQTSEDFDDALLPNQMATFQGFADQGELLLQSKNLAAFQISVNGKILNTRGLKADTWQALDIADLTKNGDNKLQVTRLNSEKSAKLKIKIPYPTLIDGTKNQTKNDTFALIDQIVESEIKEGFTSAQLVITKNGKMIKNSAYGTVNAYQPDGTPRKDSAKVTKDTLYDLASNTKMYGTNYALQTLVSSGKLDLDQKIAEIFPEFQDNQTDAIKGKNNLTVRNILEHQAGFPADPQYHNNYYDPKTRQQTTDENANLLYTQDRQNVLKKIIETPLEYTPGTQTQYSDVDYILLGFVVEEITGKRLDHYLEKTYYQPLELDHVTFNPLEHGFKKSQIAATELNGNTRDGAVDFRNIRKGTIQGEAHDEKAFYTMKGVSGHAGLFSNATDLATLTQITLNRGGYGNHKFFDEDTLDNFRKPQDHDPSFGLGWRRKGEYLYAQNFSPLADTSTIGHTGWVGTLTVIDPVNHMSVVLLTNTKNTPVLDKDHDPNDFTGNHYLTGNYGLIATLAFDSFTDNSKNLNDSKVIEMLTSKYHLIKDDAAGKGAKGADELNYDTKPDRASLKALTRVLKTRKKDSLLIREFMDSETWQEITDFLQ